MTRLGVNIDHCATLRQLRGTPYPDIIKCAELAWKGRAHSITVHLREDRRHIQDHDVSALQKWGRLPINLEMAPHPKILDFAIAEKIQRICLVPERRREVTTEGGLDITSRNSRRDAVIQKALRSGIRVSLFLEISEAAVERAIELGVHAVEFHTGHWVLEKNRSMRMKTLRKIVALGKTLKENNIEVHAGHGLSLATTQELISHTRGMIDEVNIGHAIVALAVEVGLEKAVRKFYDVLRQSK